MSRGKKYKRKMFISVLPGEQVEVALSEESKLQEYYVEMVHQAKTKGNIYKGYINNIDPNLQAAFVNYGGDKNGFLQIDEVHPEYYLKPHDSKKGYKYPLIQKVMKAGQEVLVQVVKEPTGTKGAFLTSYLSLPGRYVVLTPGRDQIGISRKIEDDEARAQLKEMLDGLDPGEGLGVIVRTASIGVSKTNLSKDLQFLKRLWKDVRKKGLEEDAPALIYKEPDLAVRAVRDYLTDDVGEIWVDDEATADSVRDFAALIFPRRQSMVKEPQDRERSLWERFNLTKQLEAIYSRRVTLPSGGEIVFDQTEALLAVDVNSGKIGGKSNFQEMAFRTNKEAAETVAQQLRLRDLGGQVVVDFIEMKDKKQCAEVEKILRQAMKVDRARHDVGRMSKFGLLQIVRQRLGSSALSLTTEPCPECGGTGLRRNMEWQAMRAITQMITGLRANGQEKKTSFAFPSELAFYLLNTKRQKLLDLEREFDVAIHVEPEKVC